MSLRFHLWALAKSMWHECVCATVGPARDVCTTYNLTQKTSITIFFFSWHSYCSDLFHFISISRVRCHDEIVERDSRIATHCEWADFARRHLQFNSVLFDCFLSSSLLSFSSLFLAYLPSSVFICNHRKHLAATISIYAAQPQQQ